ncbi:MAG: transglycosylase SLT domain-containing protein [Anaerolineae bacterium]|jgi:soluble lytic murein transglycosylase
MTRARCHLLIVLLLLLAVMLGGCDGLPSVDPVPAATAGANGEEPGGALAESPVATASPEPAPEDPLEGIDTATPPAEPQDVDSMRQDARQAAWRGDLEHAIALWNQIGAAAEPELQTEVAWELAQLYLQAGDTEKAMGQASWLAAVEADPSVHADALGLLGTAQQADGDYRAAAASLEEYAARVPAAAPYVWWRIAACHKAVDDIGSQLDALEQIDTTRLEPSFRAEVLSELASAYRANSDPNSALTVYDDILSFASIPDYRALVTHYKGETLREASHEEEAVATFYEVANNSPQTFAATLALKELLALPETPEAEVEASDPVSGTVATPGLSDLTRGKIHYFAGEYNLALEYLNYYLDAKPERGQAEAHYYIGLTLGKQGDYEGALAHLRAATESAGDQALLAEAWFARAFTIGASGADSSGFYHEFYVNHPDHPRAAEALWRAANASEDAGNWKLAADYYGLLADKYPADKRAADAAFRQGLAWYAMRDPYSASNTWRARLDATQDPVMRVRLIVWMGLAARQAGQMDQADIFWQEAVRIAPNEYYGLRAADLLQHTMPRLPSGVSGDALDRALSPEDWEGLEAWVSSWTPADDSVLTDDPAFHETEALYHLEWFQEARESDLHLRQVVRDRPFWLVELAQAAESWRAYSTEIWAAQRLLRLGNEAGAAQPPDALRLLAYPVHYADLIAEYARHYDLDPLLMLALVRQESLFDTHARSYAGAVGLAQIMPPTGEWIASQIGPEDYAVGLLVRPYLNLRYSAWFMNFLINLYDRDWIAALVAYNAGPGNLKEWSGGGTITDHDLFWETLPSQQAHDYVRLIYENYSWYRKLYRTAATPQ